MIKSIFIAKQAFTKESTDEQFSKLTVQCHYTFIPPSKGFVFFTKHFKGYLKSIYRFQPSIDYNRPNNSAGIIVTALSELPGRP